MKHALPHRSCSLLIVFLIVSLIGGLLPPSANADKHSERKSSPGDWPKFLGPHGTGISDETDLAESWPHDGPPVLWSRETGVGYAAPSVRGNQLVLHHRRRDEEIVECFEATTGESLWRHTTPTDFTDPFGYNGGPRATPFLTKTRCYTLGAGGHLTCLKLAGGDVVWHRDLAEDFTVPDWFFGMGCSPILYKDLLIVLVGGQPDCAIVAFDAETGTIRWHAGGKPTWNGAVTSEGETYQWTGEEMLVSYATPTVATFDGRDHLLCLLRQGLVSLKPEAGEEYFHYWFRSQSHQSVNAARPVVVGDQILLTAAYRTGAALLEVDGTNCEEVWRKRENLACHWSTPIVVDGIAYGFSGRHENGATLRAIEWATGKLLWNVDGSEPVRDQVEPGRLGRGYRNAETGQPAPWPYFGRGSKIFVDGRYLILGERGTLAMAKFSRDGYEEIARCDVPEISYPAWTAPVLAHRRLYLRDEDTLVCLDISKRR